MISTCRHEYINLVEVDHLSSDGCVVVKSRCEDCEKEYLAYCWPTHYRDMSDLTGAGDLQR